MRHQRVYLLTLPAAWAVALTVCAQPNSQPNPYRTVQHWFTLPEGRTMGSTSAVWVAPSGHIWVAERCGANSCANSDLAPAQWRNWQGLNRCPGARACRDRLSG